MLVSPSNQMLGHWLENPYPLFLQMLGFSALIVELHHNVQKHQNIQIQRRSALQFSCTSVVFDLT